MAAASGAAVARAEAGHGNLARGTPVDRAFLLTEPLHLAHPHAGRGQQVVDMPAQRLFPGKVPAYPRFEIARCATRINVAARRKGEFAKPPDYDAYRL